MNRLSTFLVTAAAATIAFAGTALAEISVTEPWARASAGMANAGAAFMMIHNSAAEDDTLVAATADVSKKVELHTHTMDNGVMKMREVEGGIPVPAHGMQALKPGSYHVMFMGLNAPLQEGSTFPVTLTFKSGQELTVDVQVKGVAHMPAGGMMNMDHEPKTMMKH
ncbi:MAG: copper chaperone PCu(A)C [Alphaproteobacteria bacterium]|nr:copper chaperone PCu(A)C [Alphaproteobacteria bacterium]